jgi:hypothetical protein
METEANRCKPKERYKKRIDASRRKDIKDRIEKKVKKAKSGAPGSRERLTRCPIAVKASNPVKPRIKKNFCP